MGRLYLRNIAKETIAITSEGGYKCNGEYIELVGEDFSSVEVLSPERLEEIEEDEDVQNVFHNMAEPEEE